MIEAEKERHDKLPEQIFDELTAICLTRATDVLDVSQGQIRLKEPDQMKPEHGAAIAAVEKTSSGWKVKFYDKLKALELLGSYLGIFSGTSRKEEENNLLEAIVASTQEVIDIHDIQQLQ